MLKYADTATRKICDLKNINNEKVRGHWLNDKFGEIIAAGMAEYNRERHHSLAPVIEEADEAMYAHKRLLKKKVSFASTSLS